MKECIIDLGKHVSDEKVDELTILLFNNGYCWKSGTKITNYPLRELSEGINAIHLNKDIRIVRSDLPFYKKVYAHLPILTFEESKYLFNNK